MKIIGIESTCDETSIALLEDKKIVDCRTWSQVKVHQTFGGVVPQIASKLHAHQLPMLLDQITNQQQFDWQEIDVIAYASQPGLIGCLKMGEMLAKTIGSFYNIRVLQVNHLHAHLYAVNIDKEIPFPSLGLVISGGHTQMFYIPKNLEFKKIGDTLDDAAGEVLDKIGRSLHLDYPAGSKIEQLAKQPYQKEYQFNIYQNQQNFNFSFSGLKTHALNLIAKEGLENIDLNGFAYFLQQTLFQTIKSKLILALKRYPVRAVVVAGGVVANQTLRKILNEVSVPVLYPKKEYCTDNGAMIAITAYYQKQQ